MDNTLEIGRRGPGRPRQFDMNAALDAALLVFRERGYHAASLTELSSAMGLTAGSIYKAFSDKRAIFLAAFDRYTDVRSAHLRGLLDAQQSGEEKLRAMLRFYAESSQGIEGRRGCLVVASATEIALFDEEMTARVTRSLQRVEALFRDIIKLGQSDKSIVAEIDPDTSARILLCLVQGFRVVGKIGQTPAEVTATVDQTMRLLAK